MCFMSLNSQIILFLFINLRFNVYTILSLPLCFSMSWHGRMIGVAKGHGGLYFLHGTRGSTRQRVSTPCHWTSFDSTTSQIWLQSRCLGHHLFSIPRSLFPHLFKKGLVDFSHYDVCQFAKHHHTTFLPIPNNNKSVETFLILFLRRTQN